MHTVAVTSAFCAIFVYHQQIGTFREKGFCGKSSFHLGQIDGLLNFGLGSPMLDRAKQGAQTGFLGAGDRHSKKAAIRRSK